MFNVLRRKSREHNFHPDWHEVRRGQHFRHIFIITFGQSVTRPFELLVHLVQKCLKLLSQLFSFFFLLSQGAGLNPCVLLLGYLLNQVVFLTAQSFEVLLILEEACFQIFLKNLLDYAGVEAFNRGIDTVSQILKKCLFLLVLLFN